MLEACIKKNSWRDYSRCTLSGRLQWQRWRAERWHGLSDSGGDTRSVRRRNAGMTLGRKRPPPPVTALC
eukprot:scaffold37606_cov27-Tisochrysis_lutea.AAC.6